MTDVISHQIAELMRNEFGPLGEDILKKQCKEMGVMPDDISLADVDELSERIFNSVRYLSGLEKSQKIKSHIRKHKLLRQLHDLEDVASDDIKRIKECKLLLELGFTTLNNLGDMDSALEYLARAAEIAKKMERRDLQAEAQRGMSMVHLDRFHLDKAEDAAKKGLELCEGSKLCDALAECKRGIAICHWRKGEFEQALNKLEEVGEIYKEMDDKNGIAIVYKNFGDIYGEMEDFEKSLKNYEKSAELYGKEGKFLQRTTLLMNMGVVYSIEKDWENAVKYYRLSEDLARKERLPNRLAWILFNLGEAYTYLHEFEKAESSFAESKDIFENQKDSMGLAGVNIKHGQMYVEKGEYERAVPLLKTGIALLSEHNIPRYAADAIHELGKARAKMREYEKAKKRYQEALKIYRSIDLRSRVDMVEKDLQELTKSLK